jgi:hypothetical protein
LPNSEEHKKVSLHAADKDGSERRTLASHAIKQKDIFKLLQRDFRLGIDEEKPVER